MTLGLPYRPALTLRRLLLLLVAAGAVYVGAIALIIAVRVEPVATQLESHSISMLSAHDAIRQRLNLLDASIETVHSLAIRFRANGAALPAATLDSAEHGIRGRLDSAALISYPGELPRKIRVDLASAAHSQSRIGLELLDAVTALRQGHEDDAMARLRHADEQRRTTETRLHEAERVALADMVARESRLADTARLTKGAVLWWLAIGVGLLPLLAIFIRARFYEPLRELGSVLRRIASGDLGAQMTIRRDDELGRLGRHLNETVAMLRIRADDERRRRENLAERLGRLLEESDNQILVLGGDTLNVVQASRGSVEQLGYTIIDLQSRNGLDLFPGADAAAFARVIQELRERGEGQVAIESRLLRKDGRSYPVTMNVQLSFAEQPPVFVVVAQDISEKREAERLREALREFSLARGSLLAIGDAERSLQEITAATARVLGAERASIWRVDRELLRCYDRFDRTTSAHTTPPDIAAEACADFVQALKTERVIAVDDVRSRPRFDLRAAGIQSPGVASSLDAPVRTGNQLKGTLRIERRGEPRPWSAEEQSFAASMADFAAIAFEVAERRSLQIQLAESQRMESVGQLAGGVAHDFNNLLTAVLSHTELAGLELPEEHPALVDLKGIQDAAARAAELTRQLLTFARRQVVDPKVVDLNDLTRKMNKLLRRLIGEDVELVTILDPDLGAAVVDPTQFEQVVVNLAVNARDAMPGGGKLTIHTTNVELDEDFAREHADVVPGHYVMVAVSDTGVGMDEAIRARIFEPFFTTKDKSRGTGLGLATVYGIVRQAGGYIIAMSQVNYGSTFKVFLPRAAATLTPAAAPAEAVPSSGNETILLVEDEPQIRSVLVRGLEAQGYSILVAGNGAEALELARRTEEPIHLLLTDVVMPLMNGPDLALAFAEERPDTTVIFMSGYTDQAIGNDGVVGPGITFLAKPFTVAELARKVRETLDTARVPATV